MGLLAVLLLGTAAPSSASRRGCGRILDGNGTTGAFAIVAENMSCSRARQVTKTAKDACSYPSFRCRARGFSCRGRIAGDETVRYACSRGRARVVFNRYSS